MESVLQQHDVKIGKLEDLVRDHDSQKLRMEMQDKIDEKKLDLQNQIEKLGGGHAMPAADVAKTLVVGGLQGFDSLHLATAWLTLRMKELQGTMHTGTYMKSPSFQGLMFVKFRSGYERDLAVGILRSARLKHDDKNVWATQDLPAPVRARKLLLMGLQWQLGEWGFVKKEFEIDDLYTHVSVGGKVVLKVSTEDGNLKLQWDDAWAAWDEFQAIVDKGKGILDKQGKGAGKSKTADAKGQLRPGKSVSLSHILGVPTNF